MEQNSKEKYGKNLPTVEKPNLEPMELSEQIDFFNGLGKLPALRKDCTAEQLAKRTQEYFELCSTYQVKPGIEGLALAIGTTRQTMWNWQNDKSLHGSGRGEVIQRAKTVISAMLEQWMATGKINPVTGIFWQKNHFGYKDQQELSIAAQSDRLQPNRTPEEIAMDLERIKVDIPIDEE